MTALLSGNGLYKRFGAQTALDHVDFALDAGSIVGLVGANGAGKSTLLKIVAGALVPDAGELLLDGAPLVMSSMRDARAKGIALVSQELNLFPALTIDENLSLVANEASGRKTAAAEFRDSAKRVLSDLGLHVEGTTRLGRLSLGDRQLVEIARALLQRPRVLILDEPTSALHKAEKERLLDVVRRLRDQGVGIVYVSHFLEEVLEIADRLIVLRDGKRIDVDFALSKERLGDVVAAMLGDRAKPAAGANLPAIAAKIGQTQLHNVPHLSIENLKGPVQLDVPHLRIEGGKVVGVAGLAGAGVEELFAILFGRSRAAAGRVRLPSGKALPTTIAAAVSSGVAYSPADRKRVGLMLRASVMDNLVSVRSLVQARDGAVLNRGALAALTRSRCDSLNVKYSSPDQRVETLSGGNQQKIVFGKWLEADPSLILLDDPTRGVDIGAKYEMHTVIRAMADQGRVVLMYSSDPLELVKVADGVHVFVDGRLAAYLDRDDLTEHGLVAAMNAGAGSHRQAAR